MITKAILLSLFLGAALASQGKDLDPGGGDLPTVAGATKAAKRHVRSFMEGDFKKLGQTYAKQVQLVPGHEMLKEEYGLGGAQARKEGLVVDQAKMREAMEKAFQGRPVVPAERLDQFFKLFEFTVLEAKFGDYATDPPDPVDTPDGKVHFMIEEGDVLIKAGPKKGDFLLFQLRLVDGKWNVVAEFLD